MPRLAPTIPTLRSLFARSGNQCAFPGCAHILVDDEHRFLAQVCHIAAAARGGERFDPAQTEEERRSPDNLLLLCYAHHQITNDVSRYPVAELQRMKREHEMKCSSGSFVVDEATLTSIHDDITRFWSEIAAIDYSPSEERMFPREVNTAKPYWEVSDELRDTINTFEQMLARIQSGDTSWDYLHIGIPNHLGAIRIRLAQMEVQALEAHLRTSPGESELVERLERARADLKHLAETAQYVD